MSEKMRFFFKYGEPNENKSITIDAGRTQETYDK